MFITLLCISHNTNGQSYYFKHYQVENGLSNNAVICTIQDHLGFLWFGTKDGLNRFDGYTFKTFRNNTKKQGSIGSNFIYALYEDENKAFWVGTENGLFTYNVGTEQFALVEGTANLPVSEITSDNKGNLWFISGLTLYKLGANNKISTFHPTNYFEATSICKTEKGDIWVSTSDGFLNQYDQQKNSFTKYNVFKNNSGISSKWIERIKSTNDAEILVGTGSAGVKIFDTKKLVYQDIQLQHDGKTDVFVRDFLQTSKDELWVGTEEGIFIYNRSSGNSINLRKKYNDPYSLADNAVYSFCVDNEGGIWATTYFGGVNYFPKQYTPFEKYFPKIGEKSLSGNVVREIVKDKYGNLWIGTEDAGLNKIEASTGAYINYKPSNKKGSLSYANIHGLLAIGDELWIGTFEHGLDVMNIKSGKVVRHYSSTTNQALKSNFIYTIYQSPSGEILIGTTIGIYKYNGTKDLFEPLPGMPLYNWYTSIIEDANGVIWTGTFGNGVNYYDTKTGNSGNLRYNAKDKRSLSSDRVNAIFEDSNKELWFATEEGLCKWSASEKKFKRYNTTNGFPSNFIISLLEDENKKLWISTTKGLVCFDPATEKLNTYTIANGLLSDQFNFSSAYKDVCGKMYFGSSKGMISFNPKEFVHNRTTPPIYITGFQVNNKDIHIATEGSPLKNAITFTDKIQLQHNQSTFSIDFSALSYTAPEMVEYAYKLEGLNDEWTVIKKNRKVFFTELMPGNYTFKVKALNSSGIWSKEEKKLIIEILPPWWASSTAILFYIVFTIIIVFYFLHSYHQKIDAENKRKIELLEIAKEKEIFKAKIDFFTNVAHEIRTPLTLIKGPLDKVIRKTGDIQEIQNSLKIMDRNTKRLIDLTNQLLDFREMEINGYSLSFVKANISELIIDTYQSFEELAIQKGININITVPATALFAFVDIDAFNKILYNLFSNAVKYGENKIDVHLSQADKAETFILEIANDGHIIPAMLKEKIFEPFYRIKETEKMKGTGIGLALARSLAQLHNGTLVMEEPEGLMNIFKLELPIHQEIEFTLIGRMKTSNKINETENIIGR